MYNVRQQPDPDECDLQRQLGPDSGGGMYNVTSNPVIKDSIFWGNGTEFENVTSTPVIDDSIVAGGCPGGGTCTNVIDADPLLGALANNGGFTQTMALGAGSPAIDAGNNATCAATDQRGVSRPHGSACDMGAFELDNFPPTVSSIILASANPTSAFSVKFTVTFSEPVTGVDAADFSLTTTGISDATVSGVSGSGNARTVTVNTGTGDGTIRLDIPVGATIADPAGNSLINLPFTDGQTYIVNKSLAFNSIGASDGWMLELSETSMMGGTMNAAATTFILGDDAGNRQYRAILSFNTASLPDAAVIQSAVLKHPAKRSSDRPKPVQHAGCSGRRHPQAVLWYD